MSENHLSITMWQSKTFGDLPAPLILANRANDEMAELIRAYAYGRFGEIVDEAADIKIVLHRLAESIGENLDDIMGMKWVRDPDSYVDTLALGGTVDRCQAAMSRLLTVFLREHLDDGEPRMAIRGVVLRLVELCAFLRQDLQEAVDSKMAVNRHRNWDRGSDGRTRHVQA